MRQTEIGKKPEGKKDEQKKKVPPDSITPFPPVKLVEKTIELYDPGEYHLKD